MDKNNSTGKINKIVFVGVTLLIVISIFVLANIDSGNNNLINSVDQIKFVGKYLDENNSWSKWNDDIKPNTNKQSQLKLKGHFVNEIKSGERLNFYIQNLEVHIKVNGEEIYSYASPGSYPSIMQSSGSVWGHAIADSISSSDEIEITLITKYDSNYFYAYNTFLDSMCLGDSGDLLLDLLKHDFAYAIGGIIMLVVGLFILIMSVILSKLKIDNIEKNLVLGFHFLIVGLFVFISGHYISLIFPYPLILILIEPICLILMILLFIFYQTYYVEGVAKTILNIGIFFSLLSLIILIVFQFTGLYDGYASREYMATGFIMIQIIAVLVSVYSLKNVKQKDTKFMLFAVLVYGVFILAEGINYFTDFFRTSALLIIGLSALLIIQGWLFIKNTVSMAENAQKVVAYEKEIADSRIAVMLSQIQPHFLYNALNTIRYLCKNDPALAASTVEKFSKYLRGNLDSLNERDSIRFTKEIEHLDNYLGIEKLRFENIDIIYDFDTVNFHIPPLTVQPMVENAIKHGISTRGEGGTVIVKTEQDKNNYYVKIIDDGVGFDSTEIENFDISHVGISNTKKRVEVMCSGSFNIDSKVGTGTEVTITLPKNKNV